MYACKHPVLSATLLYLLIDDLHGILVFYIHAVVMCTILLFPMGSATTSESGKVLLTSQNLHNLCACMVTIHNYKHPVDFVDVPTSVNVTVGQHAAFRCNHSSSNQIGWMVNDTTLIALGNTDVTTSSVPVPDGSYLHQLMIWARREYNQTRIQCLAFVGGSEVISPHAMLLIQGEYCTLITLSYYYLIHN